MGYLHDLYAAGGSNRPDRGFPTIIGDKSGYRSPIDRTIVDGRTAHREHMKRHSVVEAGDMKLSQPRTDTPLGGVRTDINKAIQELNR